MSQVAEAPVQTPRPGFEREYPFASHYFDLGGLKYHYIDEGAGEVLLCVHGNPTWSFAWRNLIKDLSADYRVIAVDHIGCGLSDKPQKYEYCLETHVRNLEKFVTGMNLGKITLLGHDWGGAIGMGTAGRLEERFARFVLLNTAAFRSIRMPWRIAVCRWPLIGATLVRGLNMFARGALRMAVCHPERMTREVRAGYLAPYDSWAHRIALLRFVQDIPMSMWHPSCEELLEVETKLLRFQRSPVLLAWGMRDWCFSPEFLDEFQRRLPWSEVFPIEDAGHYVLEDAHERIIPRVRQFLSEHPLDD